MPEIRRFEPSIGPKDGEDGDSTIVWHGLGFTNMHNEILV